MPAALVRDKRLVTGSYLKTNEGTKDNPRWTLWRVDRVKTEARNLRVRLENAETFDGKWLGEREVINGYELVLPDVSKGLQLEDDLRLTLCIERTRQQAGLSPGPPPSLRSGGS